MMDKQKEDDMMDDMMEEQVVSPKKEIGKMHALIEREERDKSPLKKKVLEDRTKPSPIKMREKSKDNVDLFEEEGFFSKKKVEKRKIQGDIAIEDISEDEVR